VTGAIRDRRTGRIRIRRLTRPALVMGLTLLVLIGVTVAGFFLLDAKGVQFGKALRAAVKDFGNMLLQPRAVHLDLWEALREIAVTLGLAFMTTLLGAVAALVFGLLAAQNLASRRLSNLIKAGAALVRAVPTVLWVLIFAIGAGLGAVAAVIGMSFHSFSYLLKAYSESFEELEPGVIEALKASGASWLQIVFQAVIPSSISYLLSWTFVRFEINFVTAVAMGAAAGAGGIGFDLYMASGHYFNIREVGFITYLILGVAVLLEVLATRLKRRYRLHG
jgi:phosphonate transport system permease protein